MYLKNYAILCKFGKGICCNLYRSSVRMRRDFDTSNWDSKGGHIYSQKHGGKKTARKYRESIDEMERLKAEEDGIVVLPKKSKAQALLLGLFRKASSTSADASNTEGSSSTNKSRASSTRARVTTEGIIPMKFGYGKSCSR